MADMTNQEWREWFNSQPEYVQKQVLGGMSDEQKVAVGVGSSTVADGSRTTSADGTHNLTPEEIRQLQTGATVETEPGSGNYEDPSDPLSRALAIAEDRDQWEREMFEADRAKIDALGMSGTGTLQQAGQNADAWNAAIVGNMVNQGSALGQEVDYGGYVGDAASDPSAAGWQYGAMGEYAQRAQGGFTPIERAQMEMNRRMQERDLRSQREAQLRDLQMRGASSSGLEIAQMLGAQQGGAERRMLQDMQQASLAQQRADRALDSGAALASDIRGQSFGESSFNKQLQQQYQGQKARHTQNERNRQWGIVTDTSGAASGAVADAYAHQTAPTYFEANLATGNRVSQPTGSGVTDALGKIEGRNQANKAADLLEDDEGALGLGISLPGGITL